MDSESTPQIDNNTNLSPNQQEKLGYVYRHIRLDTNMPFYIGKGTNSDGYYTRAYSSDRTNPHWHNIVNKHGHRVEIIIDGLTEKEANKKEVELILLYGRRDLGTGTLVNLTDGGEGTSGIIRTPEHIEKIRQANLGKKHTEQSRKKMSNAKRGNTSMLGKQHTKEAIEKIRESSKNRRHTEETKEKFRKQKSCKPVGQYNDEVLINQYPSLSAAKINGFDPSLISKCCRGKIPHHKGFQWRYL